MKILCLYLLILLKIEGCDNQNQVDMNCDKENAKSISDGLVENKGSLKVSDMIVKIEEDNLHFVIEYLPKDSMILGGGGKFTILKSDCKIVEQKFYQ